MMIGIDLIILCSSFRWALLKIYMYEEVVEFDLVVEAILNLVVGREMS